MNAERSLRIAQWLATSNSEGQVVRGHFSAAIGIIRAMVVEPSRDTLVLIQHYALLLRLANSRSLPTLKLNFLY
jgi:hypothetical protein